MGDWRDVFGREGDCVGAWCAVSSLRVSKAWTDAPASRLLRTRQGVWSCTLQNRIMCTCIHKKKPSKNLPTDKGILEVCSWQRVIFYD